jgi:Tyrosine phosphatase family
MKALACLLLILASAATQAEKPCDNNVNSPITNFCISTQDVLWRGAKPYLKDATWLIDQGIASIVNLELLHDDLAILKSVETNLTTQINYYKVRDWEPNVFMYRSRADINIAKFIAVMNKAPKPVYVHCRSGQNRTGVMVAAYRIVIEATPITTAIDEMKRYAGIWAKHDEKYLLTLTPEKVSRLKEMATGYEQNTKPNAVVRCAKGSCDK